MPPDANDPGNPENRVRTRLAQAELRQMLLRWDPIGISDAPEAADEYDCLISPLMDQLHRGTTASAVSQWLSTELEEHFGMGAEQEREGLLAAEIMLWWNARLSESEAK